MKGRKSWLRKELEQLERTDPDVAAARARLDEAPEDIARYERHMAARKAVGKRALPENPLALVCAAITLVCAAVATSAAARADGDNPGPDPNVVRGMYDAGVPPAEIPHDIIRNNPRLNSPTLPYQVFRDLQDR
jgi:hypothetical protein